MAKEEEFELVSVRMPVALADALREEAERNTRSLSGEAVHRLKQTFAPKEGIR